MSVRAPRVSAGCVLALAFAAGCGDRAAGGGSGSPDTSGGSEAAACEPATMIARLPELLVEASGVARDPRPVDLVWAHNDSGNPAELFALDGNGNVVARVAVTGGTDRDLEDAATGTCGDTPCLILADIGDNLAVHPFVSVHRVALPPRDGEDATPRSGPPNVTKTWRFAYPDGPRDAESLVVDGLRGELLVITKGREGVVEMYATPLDDEAAASDPQTLRRIGALAIPVGDNTSQLVTGADLSPDGTRLAVRSYTTVFLYDWSGTAAFDTASAPSHASLLAALEAQGEGITWVDDETLILVSEGRGGRPPTISRIRCPRS